MGKNTQSKRIHMIFSRKEDETGKNVFQEEALKPSEIFIFNYDASPEIAEKLGLEKNASLKISPHTSPLLDARAYPDVEEFEVTAYLPEEGTGHVVEGKRDDLRVFHAHNFWLITHGDFIYIEPRAGANFSGIKKLAQVQAKVASIKPEGVSSDRHWVLVNFAGLPAPSAGELIAGIIAAAMDALKKAKSEIAVEGFCETSEYLFSQEAPNREKRDTVFNFIRLGSMMDDLFVSPNESGSTHPKEVMEYLLDKMRARERFPKKK
jgi:hypothetical protein